MRTPSVLVFFLLFSVFGFAQSAAVKDLVKAGIALHDKGDFEGAIKKYDAALQLDKDDFDAAYEKSLSLMYLKRYEDCIALSKTITEKFDGLSTVRQVYSNWGSALDDLGRPDEALKVFDKGIAKFPSHYLLHFNKGLTLVRMKRYTEAVPCYQAALKANPLHPSSHYQLGVLLKNANRIASLLSYLLFIACEPQTERSKAAYEAVQENVYRNVVKEGNRTTVNISTDLVDAKRKKGENDFGSIELFFSLSSAMDNSSGLDSVAKGPVAKFDLKLQMLCNALAQGRQEGTGFYWEHCAPFFAELKEKGYTDVLSNLLYLSRDIGAQLWVDKNREKVDAFYQWFQSRTW